VVINDDVVCHIVALGICVLNQVVGRFRIVRLLGEGGTSSVYLGERTGDFEQRTAIKILREGLHDPAMRYRFRAEQQVLASLQHPNIVQRSTAGSLLRTSHIL